VGIRGEKRRIRRVREEAKGRLRKLAINERREAAAESRGEEDRRRKMEMWGRRKRTKYKKVKEKGRRRKESKVRAKKKEGREEDEMEELKEGNGQEANEMKSNEGGMKDGSLIKEKKVEQTGSGEGG